MRSLLFVPADGGSKLDKALASGADAVIVDLEDSIAPDRKEAAREAALDFLQSAGPKKDRPRLFVRVNGLDTGMTDADLYAVVPGRPDGDAVSQGGRRRRRSPTCDAKLTALEADRRSAAKADQDFGADGGIRRPGCSTPARSAIPARA